MVKGFFDGGEPLNLHLHSPAVTLGNGLEIVVKSVQSLQSGYCLDQTAMDSLVYLFTARDLQLCDAHKQVNEKLRGYVQRERSQLGSDISNILFDGSVSMESILQHPRILEIITSKSFSTCYYRTIIPYFWIAKSEWVLIIIDTVTSSVQFLHPFYASDISAPISPDNCSALNIFLKDNIVPVLQNTMGEEYVPGKWTFHMNTEENGRVLVINGTRTTVYNPLDSGLYVLFAMECDYFDSPVYVPPTLFTGQNLG